MGFLVMAFVSALTVDMFSTEKTSKSFSRGASIDNLTTLDLGLIME